MQVEHKGKPQVRESSYYSNGGHINPHWNRDQIGRFIRAMYSQHFKSVLVCLINGED